MNETPQNQVSKSPTSDLGLLAVGLLMIAAPVPLLLQTRDFDPLKIVLLGALVIPPALALLLIQRRRGRSELGLSAARTHVRR